MRKLDQCMVNVVQEAAWKCLPHIKARKKKKLIADSKFPVQLCKLSKIAWKRWRNAGTPNSGTLHSEMKETKRAIRKHISVYRARKDRTTSVICLFKTGVTIASVFSNQLQNAQSY